MISLQERCAKVDMLLVDVDGVLTDGSIVYGDDGRELKAFHVRDGTGLKIWLGLGKKAGIITGRSSPIVDRRARELGISAVAQGMDDKLRGWQRLLGENDVRPDAAAYMGDDLLDLPVLKQAGLAIAVADACREARAAAHYVTDHPGGRGAVREVIELILHAQGRWAEVVAKFE